MNGRVLFATSANEYTELLDKPVNAFWAESSSPDAP